MLRTFIARGEGNKNRRNSPSCLPGGRKSKSQLRISEKSLLHPVVKVDETAEASLWWGIKKKDYRQHFLYG